jgi:UDP-glucose 4-epimerase
VKVLLTGGAGYIGSVTAVALEAAGHVPVILDSLVVGTRALVGDRTFYQGDIADRSLLRRIAADHPDIECTLHFAARTVVPESVKRPHLYYRENFSKTLDLADELAAMEMDRLVFSSSASVYADSAGGGVDEDAPIDPQSPYARSKAMAESALTDLALSGGPKVVMLRYFNPIGASPDLTAGSHVAAPTHVLGRLLATALGDEPEFAITGTEYPTRDGTGLRDYVHVWDVARAHVAAVERFDEALEQADQPWNALNIGTGRGTTVRELVGVVEAVLKRPIPVREAAARPGDVAGGFATVDKARLMLGWTAEQSVAEAVASAVAWETRRRANVES